MQGLSDVLLFVIFFLRLVLEYFSTVLPNSHLWKQGLSDVLLFCDSFLVFGLKSIFQQSYPFLPMKGIEWCCSLWPFLCFKSIFQQSYPIYLWKQGLSDVLLFVISFLTFGLRVFFNSPTQFLPIKQGLSDVLLFWFLSFVWSKIFFNSPTHHQSRDWVMCCSLWFLLRLVLRFFNSPTQFYLWKQGLSDVLLFVIPFFTFGLIFSTVLPNFYLWKQGLSDVLLFVIPFFVFGLKIFFQQSYPILPMKAGIEDVLLLWFLSRLVLKYFSTVPPILTWKQGLSDVLLFVIPFFVFGLKSIFQQSYPILYLSRDWVMCCSLWFLSRLVLEYFSTVLPLLPWKQDWVMLLLCDSFLYVWS
jgi:hypothetical protein